MANAKSNTARRREVRRTLQRPGPKWLRSLRRREAAWAAFYAALFALIASTIAISARTGFHYQPGQIISTPVVSRVEFEAVDKKATEAKRIAAKESEPAVFLPNEPYLDTLRQRFAGLIALADFESIEQIRPEWREQVNLTAAGLTELRRFAEQGEPIQQWRRLTDEFLQGLFDLAILRPDDYEREKAIGYGVGLIMIKHPMPQGSGPIEKRRFDNVLYSVEDTKTLRENVSQLAQRFPRALNETIVALVMQDPKPTYLFDTAAQEETQKRREQRFKLEPPVIITRQANEVLVPVGTVLSETDLDLLQAEWNAYHDQQSAANRWLTRAGLAGLIMLLGVGTWAYIFHYNERIVRNPMRGLALTALLLLCQAIAVFTTLIHPEFVYVTAIFPTLLTAIVLTIAYDQRFALAMGALHAGVVMVSLDLPIEFGLVLLTGVGVAVGLLREVRTRSTVVQVGLLSGAAMGAATLLMSLAVRPLDAPGILERILWDAGHAALTGLGVGLLVQGILPTVEKIFKVSTAMTLRELNDASHPLLQRLAQEAAGTYQHSLRIADMAEAAADAIGADGLLCRVGAMYHDIGKINKPMYFIENQGGGPNRHNKLSPAMSLLIIVGHVKDGIEMAREYHLPPAIRHFIESHHGTTLVEYFYHAARKQKEAEDAPGPSEFEFRYPGPKPQTREAAILLLCDGIEGAARALPDPTPVRLEQNVHKMAIKRLMDGQFDECNLTLQELHRIEQAITKMLCAIYHARIKYPTADAPAAPTPQVGEQPQPQPQPAAS